MHIADRRHSYADIRNEAAGLLENESKGSTTDVAGSVSILLRLLPASLTHATSSFSGAF